MWLCMRKGLFDLGGQNFKGGLFTVLHNSHGLTRTDDVEGCRSSLLAPPTFLPLLGVPIDLELCPPNDKLLRILPPPLPPVKFPTGIPPRGFVVGTLLHGVLGAELESGGGNKLKGKFPLIESLLN